MKLSSIKINYNSLVIYVLLINLYLFFFFFNNKCNRINQKFYKILILDFDEKRFSFEKVYVYIELFIN